MSRSRRDQRGKRISKDAGKPVVHGDTVIADKWLEVWSPRGKRWAKKHYHRLVRRVSNRSFVHAGPQD